MRWPVVGVSVVALVVMLAGCFQPHADDLAGEGTDPSLPGIVVTGEATWNGKEWIVTAEARNQGPATYKIDTGCSSPFSLEARAAKGQPYGEVQCRAYSMPIDFRPGQNVTRAWVVHPEDFDWGGAVHFTVVFSEAEGPGQIRVALKAE